MKIRVDKFTDDDVQTKVSFINDPKIYSNIHFDLPGNIADTRDWYNSIAKAKDRIDLVFRDEENNVIGMSGLTNINLFNANSEFYVIINSDFHGRGFGQTICIWMINFGFSKFNLHKIYLYTDSDNAAAINLYEKLGFLQEGVQREHRYKGGEFKNKVSFGLLRDEWLAKTWSSNKIEFVIENSYYS